MTVHVGLHKTATTAIQTALADSGDDLAVHGVLYPAAARPPGLSGQHNIAWQLATDRRFCPDFGTIESLASEISAFAGDAVISSEDFESVLGDPPRLLPLRHHPALRGRRWSFVLYLRDQVSYAESLFAELQRHGLTCDARSFCDDILRNGQFRFQDWVFHFDYAAMLNTLQLQHLGRWIVRPYNASAVPDFMRLIGGTPPPSARPVNRRDDLAETWALYQANTGTSGQAQTAAIAQLALSRRAAFTKRFSSGNEFVARAYRLPVASLTPTTPSPESADMEQVFA